MDRREGGVALSDDRVLRVGLEEWVEVREDVRVELDLYEGTSATANLTSNRTEPNRTEPNRTSKCCMCWA
jgi:hypothetical protein